MLLTLPLAPSLTSLVSLAINSFVVLLQLPLRCSSLNMMEVHMLLSLLSMPVAYRPAGKWSLICPDLVKALVHLGRLSYYSHIVREDIPPPL